MQALEKLGLKLKEHIGLDELLSENFNPQLYSLTRMQEEKINALKDVVAAYEDYDITTAGRLIQDFVCDHVSNWYVRLGRKRFWGGSMDA